MNMKLKKAIEVILAYPLPTTGMVQKLKEAYQDDRNAMTETAKRVEYLQECLEDGVSKREAARMLVVHDPRVSQKTAETLVYMSFSGQYRTTLRGSRLKHGFVEKEPVAAIPKFDLKDDGSLL